MATTGVACLVAAVAWILINSIYVGNTDGWPQFVLSVFAAITVVGVGLATLSYAAHQQLVVKNNLFVDHDHSGKEFEYRSTGQWAVVTGATDGIGKEYARQVSSQGTNNIAQEDVAD